MLQVLGENLEDDMPFGQGQGVGGQPQGFGGVDTCQCPECGATAPHTRGTPCRAQNCPDCGTSMVGMVAAIATDVIKLAKSLVNDDA